MPEVDRKMILLVEDEALLAMNEKMQLEKYGYSVKTVTTGEKAVEAVQTSSDIDLILMDINLGDGIDGTQAAEIILQNHDIPVVFLSSHTEPEIVEKTEKITSYGYVVKNTNITVLDASIKMAFKLIEAKKEAQNHYSVVVSSKEELEAANEELLRSEQELIRRENALSESENRLRAMLDLVPDMISIHDPEMRILYSNWSGFADVPENRRVLHTKCYKTYRDLDEECPDCLAKAVIETGEPLKKDVELPDGRWMDVRAIPLLDKNERVVMFMEWVRDITEHKRVEEDLNEIVSRHEELESSIPVGVYVVWIRTNGDKEFEHVSDRWCTIHGVHREDVLTDAAVVDNLVHPDDRQSFVELNADAFNRIIPFRWEGRFLTGDGQVRWLLIESTPHLHENGDIRWFGVTQDITARKEAEIEIEKQLSEKETLLREVHHRVKNNIATIESVLALQIGDSASAEVKAGLQVAISRVQSIRVLYENLLISEELEEISMRNYVESLLDSLIMVFDPGHIVTVETNIADIDVASTKAVTIGIILNELLTNVFKYAFRDRDGGMVSVSIDKRDENVTLIIQDNGVGIDERIMEDESQGFGLTIVRMLAEQLDGIFTIENHKGTRSILRFGI